MKGTDQHRQTTSEQAGQSPRLLFWLAVVLGLILLGLVMAGPWLSAYNGILGLFAHDVPVRRSALAAGLGLLVTAFVFFRGGDDDGTPRQQQKPRRPTPPRVVGA